MKLCEYNLNEEFKKLTHIKNVSGKKDLFKFEVTKREACSFWEEHYSLQISSTSKRPQIWCVFWKDARAFVGFEYSGYKGHCLKTDPLYSVCVEEVAKFCEEFAPFEMKELLRNLLETQL